MLTLGKPGERQSQLQGDGPREEQRHPTRLNADQWISVDRIAGCR
jgi:hypothetical protein